MDKLRKFLNDPNVNPMLAGLAAGLYPILFYYTNNYTLINSWGHLGYFLTFFVLLPIVMLTLVDKIAKLKLFQKWKKYILPFLNLFIFFFLLKVCLYAGLQKKITLGILIVASLIAFFLYKYFHASKIARNL